MSTTDIRRIVLATVSDLEPATGYAARKRLVDQGVDVWGGVSVAFVYSALSTMAKHGWLDELGDPAGIRARARAYRTTAPGRRGFHTLWRSAIETVDPARPLAFHVAITLTALVTRESSGKGRAPRSMTVADITVLQ